MYIFIHYIITLYYTTYYIYICNMNNKLVGCQELLIGLDYFLAPTKRKA